MKAKSKMRNDVLAWAAGRRTAEAYRRAYEALGIDIINRVPLENAPAPTPAGETRPHPTRPYRYAALGVYDTVMRHTYECADPEAAS